MRKIIPLSNLKAGNKGIVVRISGKGLVRRRILDMGIVKGTHIEVIRTAPLGDPVEFSLRGYNLTLRKAEADEVFVSLMNNSGEAE